jgi:hypothetical protein
MAEQLKFGDRLFLKGEKVLFDNGTGPAIIESRNQTLIIGDTDGTEHNVIINGNLTVEGTTTTVNTQQTTIADPFMLITSLDVDKAGIEVDRDGETNAQFGWNEEENRWQTFHTASLFSATLESTNLTSINLTATGTSTLDNIIALTVDIEGGNIDDTVIGATTPAAGKFTTITGDGTDITNVLTNYTTDDLVEGTTNLYFTDERVDDRISNLFNASYGISALYTDPANTFEISFDATNIGTGEEVLDTTNTTQAAFRTIREGQIASGGNSDLIVSLSADNNEIIIDTAEKINKLDFHTFTGTGLVSQYPLPYTVTQDWQVLVYIDGVVQEPTTAYTMSGATLTLSAPLANGSVMNVIKMATNTAASIVTDADTLNAQPGGYYLDYNNFTNVPSIPQTTIGDAPPTSPLNGNLWWDSSTGRLKIYYEDIDSSQWVDAFPVTGTIAGNSNEDYVTIAATVGSSSETNLSNLTVAFENETGNVATSTYASTTLTGTELDDLGFKGEASLLYFGSAAPTSNFVFRDVSDNQEQNDIISTYTPSSDEYTFTLDYETLWQIDSTDTDVYFKQYAYGEITVSSDTAITSANTILQDSNGYDIDLDHVIITNTGGTNYKIVLWTHAVNVGDTIIVSIDQPATISTGPAGPQGATGPAGPAGPAGADGADGADIATYLNGNLDTHILPDTNDTYDIGSATHKIRDLYLGDNSLHIGDNTIRTSGNSLLLNGEDIMDYSNVKNKPTTVTVGVVTDTVENFTNVSTPVNNVTLTTNMSEYTTGDITVSNGVDASYVLSTDDYTYLNNVITFNTPIADGQVNITANLQTTGPVISNVDDLITINGSSLIIDYSATQSIQAVSTATTSNNLTTGSTLTLASGEASDTVTVKDIEIVGSIANPIITQNTRIRVNGVDIDFIIDPTPTNKNETFVATSAQTDFVLSETLSAETWGIASVTIDAVATTNFTVSGQTVTITNPVLAGGESVVISLTHEAIVMETSTIIDTVNNSGLSITASLDSNDHLVFSTIDSEIRITGYTLSSAFGMSSSNAIDASKLSILAQDIDALSYMSAFISGDNRLYISTAEPTLTLSGSAFSEIGFPSNAYSATSPPTAGSIVAQINALNIPNITADVVSNRVNIQSTETSITITEEYAGSMSRLGFPNTTMTSFGGPVDQDEQVNIGVELISKNKTLVNLSTLKSIVADSTDFADFQSRIAAL